MIDGWELVIGIEIHAQVKSNSKLFSSSSTDFGSGPNSQVSLVDAAMPGMLPVINKFCVEQAVRSGIGLNAKINNKSIFDRKNYFYQDLPQGYQISQFKDPIVGNGFIDIVLDDQTKRIGIERLHLEQDAGKSLHDQDPNLTFVDLNRSGIALMEIVSNPDMSSADEAVEYIKKVRSILRYLDTCDGNMEQGSLRADVNVSVNKPGDELGTRCEIKNLNSFKYIHSAIIYEAKRQVKLIESGESINQETRLYNIDTGETRSMRSKEDAHDYRYFPDPDLLPLEIEDKWIEEIKSTIPELPDQKKNRFIKDYNLNEYDAGVIVSDKATSDYYEKVVKNRSPKLVTTWVTSELFSVLNKKNLFIGGPVLTDRILFLHTNKNIDESISINKEVSVSSDLDTLKSMVNTNNQQYKLFLGHSGWSKGQLEREIENGDWLIQKSINSLIFEKKIDDIWGEATKSLGIEINDISSITGQS